MILDTLQNSDNYLNIHKRFKQAFSFLHNDKLVTLPEGTYDIDGKNIFAIVSKCTGRKKEKAFLELHKQYIDIQYLVTGYEEIGWAAIENCKTIKTPYSYEKDLMFFDDEYENQVKLRPNSFGIFFPNDGHAPLISSEKIHKVILKIRV